MPTVEQVSYKPRDESPGYHHVFTRGNNKRAIYEDDRDRRFFCATVDRVAEKYGWTIIAYCLMRNHYHLIIRVGEKGLVTWHVRAQQLVRRSLQRVARPHQSPVRQAVLGRRLRSDGALFTAVRYVMRNPVLDGGKRPLESYTWTSYAATIGLAFAEMRLAKDELLEFYGPTPELATAAFRASCSRPIPRGHDRWQPP